MIRIIRNSAGCWETMEVIELGDDMKKFNQFEIIVHDDYFNLPG